jgi:hypothetical protein
MWSGRLSIYDFTHAKKVDKGLFIMAKIYCRSGLRRPDPDLEPTKKFQIRPDPDAQHDYDL